MISLLPIDEKKVAGAGYGQSTLLSAWLQQVNFPCAWLSLDAKDDELSRFLNYFFAALQTVDPSIKRFFDEKPDFNVQPDLELLLTPLNNHHAKSTKPLCLILDDYHVIHNHDVHQVIGFLLEHRPASFSLVIATRADPPLPLAKMRARSAVLELRQSDLCFTTQETSEFLTHTMELLVSPDDVQHLSMRTEGWIAGLQMAGFSLQGKTEISRYIHSFSGENRYVPNFLFDEVFQAQTSDTQNFLLETSILDRLCGPLCDMVTQRVDSQNHFERFESSNLFLNALDEDRKWYRYHHLFAELLRNRLAQTSPQSIPLLHQRAGGWFSDQDDLESAISHTLAVPDYEQAAKLIEKLLQEMDLINRQPLLASWIDSLPNVTQVAHPWLCAYRAYGDYWTGNRERAEDWLQKAEKSSSNTIEDSRLQGFIASVRAHIALSQENIPDALNMAQKALKLLPEGDLMHAATGISLGAVYWASGDVIQSEQAFSEAQNAALKSFPSFAVAPTCYLGIQQIKRGDLQAALATFRKGLKFATQPDGREAAIAGFPNIKIGDVLLQRNEMKLASEHLLRGVEQCTRLTQVDFLTDAYVCLGRYQLASGDLEGTLDSIQKGDYLAHHAKVDQWVLCWLDDLRIQYWLATGNLNATNQWVKLSGLDQDGQLHYLHDLHHQNLARILVAQGIYNRSADSTKKASILLTRLLEASKAAGWVHQEIIVRVMQAVNDYTNNQTETALQGLAKAILLAEPGGFVRVFLNEGAVMQTLLTKLADMTNQDRASNLQPQTLGTLRDYVYVLLSSFQSILPDEALQLANPSVLSKHEFPTVLPRNFERSLIEPLSNRELEILNLLAQGYSDKKIALSLVIAPQTVHKHLKNIYSKLSVHSRTEAIASARELHLL